MSHAGNDLTEEITPIEAGLKWTIGKRRRDACDFLGGEVHNTQLLRCTATCVCGCVFVSVYAHSRKYVCKRTASNKHLGSFDDSGKSTTGGKSISPDGLFKVLAMVQQL